MAAVSIDSYVSRTISEICQNLNDSDLNHCAHFVCHVLGMGFGYTCTSQTGSHASPAANIRVQEVFPQCAAVGEWSARPLAVTQCLIFVTTKTNPVDLKTKNFPNIPKKHVGILWKNNIYHYSNNSGYVRKQSPDDFITYMTSAYGPLRTLYGTIPVFATNTII